MQVAKNHVNLITESISNDENPTTRLLKGMGIVCVVSHMMPMEGSGFRQAVLATYQGAPPPAPAAPLPAPVIGAAASPEVDPPQLQLSPPAASLPVGPSAGPASYQSKQFQFGTIYLLAHHLLCLLGTQPHSESDWAGQM
jgi:hypothetical protein